MEMNLDTGSGSTGAGTVDVSPLAGVDRGSDRQRGLDQAHADEANSRTFDRQTSGEQKKPSGHSIRDTLKAAFAASRELSAEGRLSTDDLQAHLSDKPAGEQKDPRRGADGHFQRRDAEQPVEPAVPTPYADQQPPRPAAARNSAAMTLMIRSALSRLLRADGLRSDVLRWHEPCVVAKRMQPASWMGSDAGLHADQTIGDESHA
jgi:hypothetical protein